MRQAKFEGDETMYQESLFASGCDNQEVRVLEALLLDAERWERQEKRARDAAALARRRQRVDATREAIARGVSADVRLGDFRDVLGDLRDVDAVITEPPSGEEFPLLAGDLARWADAVLKDDGVLAVLIDQHWMIEAFKALSCCGRSYRWTCCFMTSTVREVPDRGVASRCKPLIIYQPHRGRRWMSDVMPACRGGELFGDLGEDYQQFLVTVDRLTQPGQLVVDPFAGGGTTLLASRALGRHSIGCDVDAAAVEVAGARLAAQAACNVAN